MILIVDDETQSRVAMRYLLNRLGYRTVWEARNDGEAFRQLELHRKSIRFVVADCKMPSQYGLNLLKKVSRIPSFDYLPFLITSSDLPNRYIRKISEENPRLDGHLQKPFRMDGLMSAMSSAFSRRASHRNLILYLGERERGQSLKLMFAQFKAESRETYWQDLIPAESTAELDGVIREKGSRIGAIVFDAESYTRFAGWAPGRDWLSVFKRAHQGGMIVFGCIGLSPRTPQALRTHCQLFLHADPNRTEWFRFFSRMESFNSLNWSLRTRLDQAKAFIHQKEWRLAQKFLRAAETVSPDNIEVLCLTGDVLFQKARHAEASKKYRRAMELNPYLPHPYMKLMEHFFCQSDPAQFEIAEKATSYCPNHVDILLYAAKIWRAWGKESHLSRLIDQIQHSSIQSEKSKEILSQLGARTGT